MVINGLLTALFNLFEFLTRPIDIPDIPPDIDTIVNTALGYIRSGFDYMRFWTHWDFLLILLGICLVIGTAVRLYGLVMWVLRKLPFLGIE